MVTQAIAAVIVMEWLLSNYTIIRVKMQADTSNRRSVGSVLALLMTVSYSLVYMGNLDIPVFT